MKAKGVERGVKTKIAYGSKVYCNLAQKQKLEVEEAKEDEDTKLEQVNSKPNSTPRQNGNGSENQWEMVKERLERFLVFSLLRLGRLWWRSLKVTEEERAGALIST